MTSQNIVIEGKNNVERKTGHFTRGHGLYP